MHGWQNSKQSQSAAWVVQQEYAEYPAYTEGGECCMPFPQAEHSVTWLECPIKAGWIPYRTTIV